MKRLKFDRETYICYPCSYGNHNGEELWVVEMMGDPWLCTCDCHVTNTVTVDF